jgi:hypothetical protein
MTTEFRRFEILLPLQFNDGRKIPPERFALGATVWSEFLLMSPTRARTGLFFPPGKSG